MSNLRVAIVYNQQDIYVEWTPEQFKELLVRYSKGGDVGKALDKIVADIKKETRSI